MVKISDLIAKFLKDKEIDTVFGIIGSANAHIFDSITNLGYTNIVYMHHEQAVVMAAGSYYRATGKVTAAIVTAGGGAANAFTGVVTNWADSIPTLIIAGQESSNYITSHSNLRMYGTQGFKSSESVKEITKFSKIVLDKKDILKTFEEGYYVAKNGRPGPVWLEVPFDVQGQKIDKNELIHFVKPKEEKVDYKISEIITLLKSSSRPVILVGNGIKLSGAKNLFREFINKIKIPTLMTWLGIDILADEDPYNFGRPGLYGQRYSNFVIQNSDLIISLGCRMSLPLTGYNINNFAPKAKIVMVNNDLDELKKHKDRYNITINCDVAEFIKELEKIDFECNIKNWYNKCLEYKKNYPVIEPHHLDDQKNYDNSYVTVDKLSDYIPDNTIIVFEQGTPLASGHQAFKVKPNQIIICSNGLGEMGNGLPSAIGASFTNPKKKVYLLMSDGSMMMNLQELQTLVGYKLPMKIVMFNNDGYLFIKHTQKMLFDSRYVGVNPNTGVHLPNFQKVVEAFGIKYYNSKNLSLKEFIEMEDEGISMFETFMNPEQELSPKVKGIVNGEQILAPPIEEMSPLLTFEEMQNNMVIGLNPISYQIKR